MTDHRPLWMPSTKAWAASNMGIIQHVARTRREAIDFVESASGVPWRKARKYMEVRKVTIVEGWQ